MSTIEFQNKVNEFSQILQTFAFNLTKNMDDAKDLLQETSYRALKNMDKFSPGTNLKAWLFTIMKNIFINNYRKKVKSNTIYDSTDNHYYINHAAVGNDADSNIMMKELTRMISSLDESLKVPFMMHYEGFKYQEIADELALPLGTVKSRIFFARKELKELLHARYSFLFAHREKTA